MKTKDTLITTASAKENIAKLPEKCYSKDLVTNELICIKAGVSGYYKMPQPGPGVLDLKDIKEDGTFVYQTIDEFIDQWNEEIGVTPAMREAMEIGSMFGWEVPGANVNNYLTPTTQK